MSSILQELEQQIANVSSSVEKSNVGTVRELGDGVAKVEGLSDVQLNEMIEFLLGDSRHIKEGDECKTTGKLLSVPVGEAMLGRVVDMLGKPIDGKGDIAASAEYPIEKIAPGIIKRKSVSVPVQTGIMAVDAMIPIGRGQRELIIGDRSTGKTTIAVDTIISQAQQNKAAAAAGDEDYKPLYCIYVAVGQKRANVARTVQTLEDAGALENTCIVAATASDSASNQYLAPYTGCAIAEYLMDQGKDVLIVFDDDVFYLHSRLLERSARLSDDAGGGSLTALPIIETQAGDVSAYIPTNVISITDGQIFLETDLFYQGIRPAISVGLSVSRVGSAAQTKAIKKVSGTTKLDLAQFRELQAFAAFGSDLDEATQGKIDRGQRIVELFKQDQYSPKLLQMEVAVLWAMQNGYFDDVDVDRIKECQTELEEFLTNRKSELLGHIAEDKALSDRVTDGLKQALEDFKGSWK